MEQKLKKPMTPEGYEILVTELSQLRDKLRPKVVAAIATAAAEGDRSENAEYIYGKKRLRELDKRLRYLSELIKDVQIVDVKAYPGKAGSVCFGATVTVA